MKTIWRGAALLLLAAAPAAAQDWKPDGPINIIVPWGAGGSTDQVTRVTAPILAEELGVSVVVVNQPGASGAIGTQAVLDAPTRRPDLDRQRHRQQRDLRGQRPARGHRHRRLAHLPLGRQRAADLGAGRQRVPGLRPAARGLPRARRRDHRRDRRRHLVGRHRDRRRSPRHGGFEYRMVAYDGGGPAAIATAAGEAMVTTQLAVEQTELVRGGRLRPLAVMSDQPLVVEGVDPIPPVTEWIDMPLAPDYFGIFIPRGVPDEVVATVDRIWAEQVMNSEDAQDLRRDLRRGLRAVLRRRGAAPRRCRSSSRRPARRSSAARRSTRRA